MAIWGNIVTGALLSFGLIAKAIIEAVHFKERLAAKKTICYLLAIDGALLLGTWFTFGFDQLRPPCNQLPPVKQLLFFLSWV